MDQKQTTEPRRSTVSNNQIKKNTPAEEEDYFLQSIKKKGFCYGKKPEQLRLKRLLMTIQEIEEKVHPHLLAFFQSDNQQPFGAYLVQKLLQSQSEISLVEQQLMDIWYCCDKLKDSEILITVYSNFLNDIFTANHIAFFVQTQKVIDQVVNGDSSHIKTSYLGGVYVQVERVVDIVDNIFKTSSAMSLFDGTQMQEVPFSQLQVIIQSLLTNVKIVYQQGVGQINAQELQIQCLLEFEKLKVKLQQQQNKKRTNTTNNVTAAKQNPNAKGNDNKSSTTGAPPALSAQKVEVDLNEKNKTFLPVGNILYPKDQQASKDEATKGKKKKGQDAGLLNLPGLKGYSASGKRVAVIMNEKQTQNDKIQLLKFADEQEDDEAPELTSEQELQNKIEQILNNKKKEVKKYNNNPANMAKANAQATAMNSDIQKLGMSQRIESPEKSGRGTSRDNNLMYQTQPLPSGQGVDNNFYRTQTSVGQTQAVQSYQVKKMYNADEAMNFGSADIKLKQLQLKLRESEQKITQLQQENKSLRITIQDQNGKVPDEIADRIETYLVETSRDVLSNFNDHEKLRTKHGESNLNLLNEKERSKNNLMMMYKEIGRERAFHNMAQMIAIHERKKVQEKIEALDSDSCSEKELDPEAEAKNSFANLILSYQKRPKVQHQEMTTEQITSQTKSMETNTPKVKNQEMRQEVKVEEVTVSKKQEEIQMIPKVPVIKQQTKEQQPLPDDVRCDTEFIEKNKKKGGTFTVYKAIKDFESNDERHIVFKKGSTICSFSQVQDWVSGFLESSPGKFGFAPMTYLEFEKETRSRSGTPNESTTEIRVTNTESTSEIQKQETVKQSLDHKFETTQMHESKTEVHDHKFETTQMHESKTAETLLQVTTPKIESGQEQKIDLGPITPTSQHI